MALRWRKQLWQSLEEGWHKRCCKCRKAKVGVPELDTDHNEPLYRAASKNYFQLARYCAFNFRDNYRLHGLVRFLPV